MSHRPDYMPGRYGVITTDRGECIIAGFLNPVIVASVEFIRVDTPDGRELLVHPDHVVSIEVTSREEALRRESEAKQVEAMISDIRWPIPNPPPPTPKRRRKAAQS